MKVTGYKIRQVLKEAQLELSTIQTTFDESLYYFNEEEKGDPAKIMSQIGELEDKISKILTIQTRYNLAVTAKFGNKELTLEHLVKAVGGAGRASKLWRNAAKGEKLEPYERRHSMTREKDKTYAKPSISKEDALALAKEAEKIAAAIRNAIAIGNLTEVEMEDSVGELFA